MTAKLIDGNALSKTLRADVATRAAALTARGHQPGLAVVLVGDNPASEVYVRNKVKACEDNGLFSSYDRYPATLSEADLLARIDELNRNPKIHGILVQLPLPKHIDSHKVIEAIAPEKDVDGFHVANAGALMTGKPLFRPCTPYGVMKMFEAYGIDLKGANAVVIGRSNIVGKPMALLLLEAGATVTICHSKTRDLAAHTRNADVVVAATGLRNILTAEMVKPGAAVIDVGMNRDEAGKLCGDVDFAGVKEVAGYITPVPGGVGPMTITMLLVNTIEAAERAAGNAKRSGAIRRSNRGTVPHRSLTRRRIGYRHPNRARRARKAPSAPHQHWPLHKVPREHRAQHDERRGNQRRCLMIQMRRQTCHALLHHEAVQIDAVRVIVARHEAAQHRRRTDPQHAVHEGQIEQRLRGGRVAEHQKHHHKTQRRETMKLDFLAPAVQQHADEKERLGPERIAARLFGEVAQPDLQMRHQMQAQHECRQAERGGKHDTPAGRQQAHETREQHDQVATHG
jgi:methylenetetrahydrofolate dehydrogenase (NADP+)/methenyltetrahydrofolate cyclohydrolase